MTLLLACSYVTFITCIVFIHVYHIIELFDCLSLDMILKIWITITCLGRLEERKCALPGSEISLKKCDRHVASGVDHMSFM